MSAHLVSSGVLFESDEFRRLLGWSAAAHLLAAILFAFGPDLHRRSNEPAAVFVEVVAAPAPARAARPRQVVDEPIVIPKRPRAKPKPKAAPAPVPAPVEKAEPAPSAEEILAQLRAKVGERASTAPATAEAQAPGSPGRLDPLLAAYQRKLQNLIYANWAGAGPYRQRPDLEVHFELRFHGGSVHWKLVRTSGDRFLDASAERAIAKSRPFPPPPRGYRTVIVQMNPAETL